MKILRHEVSGKLNRHTLGSPITPQSGDEGITPGFQIGKGEGAVVSHPFFPLDYIVAVGQKDGGRGSGRAVHPVNLPGDSPPSGIRKNEGDPSLLSFLPEFERGAGALLTLLLINSLDGLGSIPDRNTFKVKRTGAVGACQNRGVLDIDQDVRFRLSRRRKDLPRKGSCPPQDKGGLEGVARRQSPGHAPSDPIGPGIDHFQGKFADRNLREEKTPLGVGLRCPEDFLGDQRDRRVRHRGRSIPVHDSSLNPLHLRGCESQRALSRLASLDNDYGRAKEGAALDA